MMLHPEISSAGSKDPTTWKESQWNCCKTSNKVYISCVMKVRTMMIVCLQMLAEATKICLKCITSVSRSDTHCLFFVSSSDLDGCNQGFRQLKQETLNHRKDCLNFGEDRMIAKYWPQVILIIFFFLARKESESRDGENETRVETYVCAFINKQPESNMSNSFKYNQKA